MTNPENWKLCEQMQVKNCRDCAEQATPQTCKQRTKLLQAGVVAGELFEGRVEGEVFYTQVWE